MAETPLFGLPLLAAGQAQKHVTVNEALLRLDALASGVVESASLLTPPAEPFESAVYVVPDTGAWPAPPGHLCIWMNGGWVAVAPAEGWRVWVRDEAVERRYLSGVWVAPETGMMKIAVIDAPLAGASVETVAVIPDKAVVVMVTGRVLDQISGSGVTAWRLGVPGAGGRYGTGYGLAAGAFAQGVTGTPLAYYAPTPLLIEAEGGTFSEGAIRLAVHFLLAEPPQMP